MAWDSGRLVSTAPGEQYAPAIAADGDGGAIVAWEDSHAGRADIRAARLSVAGELLWGPAGQPVCVGPGDQFAPTVTSDGLGGAFFTWTDAAAPARGAILSARPVVTAGLPVFLDMTTTPRRAHLRWRVGSAATPTVSIERRAASLLTGARRRGCTRTWTACSSTRESGLTPGSVIEYRLAVQTSEWAALPARADGADSGAAAVRAALRALRGLG